MDEREKDREKEEEREGTWSTTHCTNSMWNMTAGDDRWTVQLKASAALLAACCLWGEWKITHTPHVALDASSFKCSLSQKWQSFVTHAWQIIRERHRKRYSERTREREGEIKRVLNRGKYKAKRECCREGGGMGAWQEDALCLNWKVYLNWIWA